LHSIRNMEPLKYLQTKPPRCRNYAAIDRRILDSEWFNNSALVNTKRIHRIVEAGC
jgi:hypothetical protein